ncbi:MAG: CDP-glycerol glycerophosphotransferase family protein, partial [Clostridia bacterium]|nr:CDP-glycerol glycerophosphotransferase family protein [Clostridia bacterium]
IKKMGTDIEKDNGSFKQKGGFRVDTMMAQSRFEADIFARVFGIEREKFLLGGLPRNDRLANYTAEERLQKREALGLPKDKIVILYAPTFREYNKDKAQGCVLAPPMDLKKWENALSETHCLLFRAHYEVAKCMEITENEFVRDMTSYPSLEDLLIAADILISDYSSIFFDFSIMDKVMLHFTYDYQEYAEKRGVYFDIRAYLSGSETEDGVIRLLENMHAEEEKERNKKFREKFVEEYGHAAEKAVECIWEAIN